MVAAYPSRLPPNTRGVDRPRNFSAVSRSKECRAGDSPRDGGTMSDQSSSSAVVTQRDDRAAVATPLKTDRGNTTIANAVVTKVASIAAREVRGVHQLGGGVSRAVGSLTQRVGIGDEHSHGVSVEVGEREA